jgi:hypothetical protein
VEEEEEEEDELKMMKTAIFNKLSELIEALK